MRTHENFEKIYKAIIKYLEGIPWECLQDNFDIEIIERVRRINTYNNFILKLKWASVILIILSIGIYLMVNREFNSGKRLPMEARDSCRKYYYLLNDYSYGFLKSNTIIERRPIEELPQISNKHNLQFLNEMSIILDNNPQLFIKIQKEGENQ